MGNESDFSNEIWEVGSKLTMIMDRMKEELKRNGNLRLKKCLRALAKAQGQLLKAVSTFNNSYKVPLEAGETWEHFLAKNYLVTEIPLQHIFPEIGFGGCRFDVLAKIGEEYIIIEAETDSGKCAEKVRKIKTAITILMSEKLETLDQDTNRILAGIREQLKGKKPLRLIFILTSKPMTSTLKSIKKEQDALVQLEVYHVNRIPPFKKSSNLLDTI